MESVIIALELSHEGLSYYAHAVIKGEIFQVKRRDKFDRYLHLLAFIAHQSFRLQDILIDTLLQCVQTTLNTTKREHKDQYYQERGKHHQILNELITNIDQHLLTAFTSINQIIADQQLTAAEKISQIAQLIEQREPQRVRATAQVRELQETVKTVEHDHDYYKLLGKKSLRLQNRVANIIRFVDFDQNSTNKTLLRAIAYYQEKDGELEKAAPTGFLSSQEQKFLFDNNGKWQISLYKALLFINIVDAIKAGTLNLRLSYKYRSLEDYLIPQANWKIASDEYLQRADLTCYLDCQATLLNLQHSLDEKYCQTNEHIQSGLNPLFKFRPDQTFFVSTPKEEEDESEISLQSFFLEKKYISLLEVLSTVNQATHFLNEFEHWQQKDRRRKPSEKTFLAGIIGLGCDIGEKKIAQISQQINEHELESTLNWFFSIPNLQAANDRILSVLDQLELPNLYRRVPNLLHTSSDGQKFEVAVESLNARHSFKYFGQNKGVTVYSFIDERHLLFHSTVISSAEREAAYVIDGLLHNEVINSDIHSTDTHGYSEVIFATTFLLGFTFVRWAPTSCALAADFA